MITIYGTSQCGFCKQAATLARQHSLQYEYKNIEFSANYKELRQKNVDMSKIPHIWWNDRYVGTFSEFADEVFMFNFRD